MPLPAYYRREDFDGTTVGSLPSGFINIGSAGFSAGTLQPYTAARSIAPASNTNGQLLLLTSPASADGNHCVQFTYVLTQPDSGNISRYDPILRAALDGSYYYRVGTDRVGNGSNILVTFYRFSGGTLTAVSGALVGGPALADGTRIWVKAEADAGTLKYKQWAVGTAEPSGWQVTQDDSSLGATGTFATGAMYAHAGTTGVIGLDHFLAATAGTTFAASYTLGLSASGGDLGSPVTATFTPDGVTDATITPAAAVAGAWSPTTATFAGSGAITAAWTPSAAGTATVSGSNSGGLTNPAGAPYTVVDPTPAATVVYTQNFDTLPTGALTDFALSGGANFVVGTTDPVSGTKSYGTSAPASLMAAVATHSGGSAVTAISEIEVYYEHIPHSPGGSGSAVFTPILRANAGFTAGYWFAGNPVGAVLNKRVGGVDAQRGGFVAFAGGTLSPDVAYNVRARCETQSSAASRIRLRVWPHGQSEPSVWDYDFLDDTDPINAAGYGGALVYSTSANVVPLAFDTVTVYDLSGVGGTPTSGPPTPGGAPSQTGEIELRAVAADGATGYQWHKSTADGFTPASGNAILGATSLVLTEVQPLATTYYILVATNSSGSANYPQVAVSGASAGSSSIVGTVLNRVMLVRVP